MHFVKRLTYSDDAEDQRYTPSYGYFSYVAARKQVLTGEFGVPGRQTIGFLDSEPSVKWKVARDPALWVHFSNGVLYGCVGHAQPRRCCSTRGADDAARV